MSSLQESGLPVDGSGCPESEPSNTPTSLSGYLLVLTAAAMWSSTGIVSKQLLSAGMAPTDLVTVRLSAAALLMVVIGLFRRESLRVSKEQAAQLFLLGALGMAGINFAYFYAISRTAIGTAVFLEYLAPALVAAWGVISGEERLDPRTAVALLLATAGCFLLVTGGTPSQLRVNPQGLVGGLAAAGFLSFYTVYGRKRLAEIPSFSVLTYSLLFAALAWVVVTRSLRPLTVLVSSPLALGYIIVFGTLIPFQLYNLGLQRLPATHAAATATAEPVIAAVLASIVLGETLLPEQSAGGLLIVVCIITLSLRERG